MAGLQVSAPMIGRPSTPPKVHIQPRAYRRATAVDSRRRPWPIRSLCHQDEVRRQDTYPRELLQLGMLSVRPASWRVSAGASPAQVRRSSRLVVSVACWKATTTAKRTQFSRQPSVTVTFSVTSEGIFTSWLEPGRRDSGAAPTVTSKKIFSKPEGRFNAKSLASYGANPKKGSFSWVSCALPCAHLFPIGFFIFKIVHDSLIAAAGAAVAAAQRKRMSKHMPQRQRSNGREPP